MSFLPEDRAWVTDYTVRHPFLVRAEEARKPGESWTRRAMDTLVGWGEMLVASGEFSEANFLDPDERARMLDWLDEHGELLKAMPEEETHPGMRRDAAEFLLAYAAVIMQNEIDDEALRCFDTEAAGIPTYHREEVIR